MCVNYSTYLHVATYMFITIEQNTNFKQNIQKNRLKIKELPERKIGEKKSKIGSSLLFLDNTYLHKTYKQFITAYHALREVSIIEACTQNIKSSGNLYLNMVIKNMSCSKIPISKQSYQFMDIPYYTLIYKQTYVFFLSCKGVTLVAFSLINWILLIMNYKSLERHLINTGRHTIPNNYCINICTYI